MVLGPIVSPLCVLRSPYMRILLFLDLNIYDSRAVTIWRVGSGSER